MKRLIIYLSVAALAAACAKPASQQQSANLPPDHPSFRADAHTQAVEPQMLKATVLEAITSGGFTYVHLQTGNGERWMVTNPVEVTKGANVTVEAAMTVEKFESKSLHRNFEQIIFGKIVGAKPLPGAPSPHAAMASAAPAAEAPANVTVEKATAANAKTVAEIWAAKSQLKDNQVVVRGTVVKFLPSIMGKNWLHLRDGSGAAAKGDNDIAVITDDTTKVGNVVTVTGTVRTDKDFGAGYSYAVLVENARVQ